MSHRTLITNFRILSAVGIALAFTVLLTMLPETEGQTLVGPPEQTDGAAAHVQYASTAQSGPTIMDPSGDVQWKFVSTESSDGPCLEVKGEVIGDSDEKARVGGCGAAEGDFHWMLGGVELATRWYNIIYGTAASGATDVRVTMEDGSAAMAPVQEGVWLVVVPDDDPLSFEVSLIEQLDDAGVRIAQEQPPSGAESHQLARQLDDPAYAH